MTKVTCHCGAVELRVTLADGLASARRCDCSFCRRRGAAAVTVNLGDLEVVKG
ncbi:MAG: GFA family protein, partial [Octadecabacter sp.]